MTMMKATKPRSHEATKRRSDEATKGKGTEARRHEGTEKRATKRRSDEATKGKGTEARRHEGTEKRATKPRSHEATERKWAGEGTKALRHEGTRGKRVRSATAAVLGIATLLTSSCVRRTITITTEPPNARVFLNDQEVGRSAVATDFLWYGDYGVTIRKEGYETLQTNWIVKPPWYQHFPLDSFTEVL